MATRTAPRTQLSPEAQLALLAISTRDWQSSRTGLLAALAERVEIDELAAYVLQQRLSIVVPAGLDELGHDDLAAELRERMRARHDQVRAEATIQSVITYGVLSSLEERGIPAVPLKGVIFSERIYGDGASRESRDIDVLVAPDQLNDAVAVVREQFLYSAPRDAVAADGRPLLHYSLSHPTGGPGLELHWRVHWYESESGVEMLKRSFVADGTRRMSPVDEFVSLLLFYARDGFVGLRNLAAITAWWDRYGATLPSSGLGDFAVQFPHLAPALATSAEVAVRLAGLPAVAQIRSGVPGSRRMARAARLANPQPGEPDRWQADVALVDLLLAPTLDLAGFLRRQMLLDTSYLNAVGVGAGSRTRWEHRARLGRIVWRVARLVLRLAAPRPRLGVGD
jgi:hypothetical protein